MTTTTIPTRATLRYHAIPAADLARYRATLRDDFGNALISRALAEGDSSPCRACLRVAGPGEHVLLLALRPFRTPGPYAETGPVFVHTEPCAGLEPGFPSDFLVRPLVLRGYDEAGAIARAVVAEPGEAEAWIAATLGDARIAFVHARNVAYGCYNFAITRDAG